MTPLRLTRLEDRTTPATFVWQGGASNFWSTPANWAGGVAPASGAAGGTVVVLGATADLDSTQDIPGLVVDEVRIQSDGYVLTLGQDLTVTRPDADGVGGDAGAANVTVTDAVTAAARIESAGGKLVLAGASDPVVSVSAGTLVVSAVVDGAGRGFVKRGAGTLEFAAAAANTYAGLTAVDGGNLRLNSPAGNSASAQVLVGNGDAADGFARLTVALAGQIPDAGSVAVERDGTFQVNANLLETVTALTLRQGTVSLLPDSELSLQTVLAEESAGPATAQPATIGGLGNLRPAASATLTVNVFLSAGEPELVVEAPLTGAGNLLKRGGGSVRLTGSSTTYTGTVTVAAGGVAFDGELPNAPVVVTPDAAAGPSPVVGGNGRVGNVIVNGGELAPAIFGDAPAVLDTGSLTFNGGAYTLRVGQTGVILGTVSATGTVTVGGELRLIADPNQPLPTGTPITVVFNDANDTLFGSFAGPDGANFFRDNLGRRYRVQYNVGDGTNDIAITPLDIVTVGPAAAPAAVVGAPFNFTITASGPNGPFTFAVTSGALPAGLTLNATTGAITGTPTASGTSTFTVSATASNDASGTRTYTVTVDAAPAPGTLTVNPSTLPAGVVGTTYSNALTVAGAPTGTTPTFTFTGTLPAGLTLSSAGVLSGTPTAAGTYSFTVTATAGGLTGTRDYTVTVTATTSPPTTSPPTTSPPVTPAPLPPGTLFVGGRANGTAVVYGTSNGRLTAGATVNPFPGVGVDVRTAVSTPNADGRSFLIAGTGPGTAARVVVLDANGGAVITTLAPFDGNFTGGVFVATGDVNNDGFNDIIVSPDLGGGPRITVYSGNGFAVLGDFFAFADDPNFRGGARVAVADLDLDGSDDLIVSAGFGGGPRVALFDGGSLTTGATPARLTGDFFAFEDTLRNGTYVAAGDVTGDGRPDLIFGGGPGGGPRVRIADTATLLTSGNFGRLDALPASQVASFFAGTDTNRGGVRVAAKDLDGDSRADVVTGSGDRETSAVRGYLATAIAAAPGAPATRDVLDPFAAALTNGVFVG